MKNKILVLLIIFLIPILVVSFIFKTNYFFDIKENNKNKIKINSKKKTIIVNLKSNGQEYNLNLEEYIIGVVSCEMPASFNIEALKAQAVASRTFVLKREKNNTYSIENSINHQCYNNKTQLKAKWGNNYEKYYSKIKESVYNTRGEYLSYNGKIINVFYFAMSNGYTEDCEYVFREHKDYLKSVESKWEVNRNDFIDKKEFTEQQVLNKLKINEKRITTLKILSRTKTNRVNKIKINNKIIKGTVFRKKLNLKSTDFDIIKSEKTIKIVTRGYGHGVGMSQYGANGMAIEGNNYKQILKYYYQKVKIKNV